MSIGLMGIASFPGVNQIISATYTLAHGITPGVIQIEMAPQANFTAMLGPVVFAYGGIVLEFDNCKVDAASFDFSAAGFIWRLQILDRRWMWAFGGVAGHYNQLNDDGSIKPETQQTPQELCTLLLDAMGEQDYDVSQVPNTTYPTQDWDLGSTVPAQALASVAEQLGCHVVLQLDGTVAILPTGTGAELPYTLDMQADSLTIDPPELPDQLVIVGSPTKYQIDIPLIAVGWNTDGTVQPLNKLNYAPNKSRGDGGFNACDLGFFNCITDPVERDKAQASIYRWYQIDWSQIDTVPGYGGPTLSDVRQILPILTEQVATIQEKSLGETITKAKPAQVFGVWFDGMRETEDANTCQSLVPLGDGTSDQDKMILVNMPFEIEGDLGIVKFDEQIYMKVNSTTGQSENEKEESAEDQAGDDEGDDVADEGDGSGGDSGSGNTGNSIGPADLMLRTSVLVRDPETWAADRYQRSRQESNAGTQPRYILHEDIQRAVVPNYGTDYDGEYSTSDNSETCNQQADYYLNAAEQEYDTPEPQSRTYIGLKAIDLDGAICQVTWNVTAQGATTAASRSNDRTPYTVPYAQRRLTEKMANLPAQVRKLLWNTKEAAKAAARKTQLGNG